MCNCNIESVTRKHLPHVYDYYDTSNSDEDCPGNPWPSLPVGVQADPADEASTSKTVFNCIDCKPPDGVHVQHDRLVRFVDYMQNKIATLPTTRKNKDAWSATYRSFHQFLLSEDCKRELCILFQTSNVSPSCDRLATQVVFKINELVIARRANSIRQRQAHNHSTLTDALSEISDAGNANFIRYIAGACLSIITKRRRVKASLTLPIPLIHLKDDMLMLSEDHWQSEDFGS